MQVSQFILVDQVLDFYDAVPDLVDAVIGF